MTVNEAHIAQMRQRMRSTSREEMIEIVKEIPLDIIMGETWRRVVELCEFKADFDDLSKKAERLEQFYRDNETQ